MKKYTPLRKKRSILAVISGSILFTALFYAIVVPLVYLIVWVGGMIDFGPVTWVAIVLVACAIAFYFSD